MARSDSIAIAFGNPTYDSVAKAIWERAWLIAAPKKQRSSSSRRCCASRISADKGLQFAGDTLYGLFCLSAELVDTNRAATFLVRHQSKIATLPGGPIGAFCLRRIRSLTRWYDHRPTDHNPRHAVPRLCPNPWPPAICSADPLFFDVECWRDIDHIIIAQRLGRIPLGANIATRSKEVGTAQLYQAVCSDTFVRLLAAPICPIESMRKPLATCV
jgi:hypothetical protein